MENLIKNFEGKKFSERSLPPADSPTVRKSKEFNLGEEMLNREKEEDDAARQRTFEIFDQLVTFFSLPANIEVIDQISGEPDCCHRLAIKLEEYHKELTNKNIKRDSMLPDILGNLAAKLSSVERLKKVGISESSRKNSEILALNTFNSIKTYIDLLQWFNKFEKEELSTTISPRKKILDADRYIDDKKNILARKK